MNIIFILTMVFQSGHGMTSITHPYSSLEKCNAAKDTNRQALSGANVLLATCTVK